MALERLERTENFLLQKLGVQSAAKGPSRRGPLVGISVLIRTFEQNSARKQVSACKSWTKKVVARGTRSSNKIKPV